MKIGSIGYNYSHGADFVIDRPDGWGAWLFLLIKSHAIFELNGKISEVKKNSFIIFSPDMPCKYRAAEDVYTDDWAYFSADASDAEKFSRLGIAVNEVVYIGNTDELSQLMHVMAYEFYSAAAYKDEIMEYYTNILLLKLSRIIQSGVGGSSSDLAEKNHRFTQLRTLIFASPENFSDIDKMASEAGMSRSGFQHLYKKMFGVSVMTDVISGRIDRAKRLLSSTNLTVKEIAERCGYNNEYNFMRQFKEKTGRTPTEYRKHL